MKPLPAAKIILFFVKYPEPGKVKTRLARQVGSEEAAHLYRGLVEKNLKVLTSLQKDGIQTLVAFDPPDKKPAVEKWLVSASGFFPQEGNILGERLVHAFAYGFAHGGQILALGSDTQGLTREILLQGFEGLETRDVVVGPARDGGYYLIGLKKACPALFEDMPWSTPAVLAKTLARIDQEGLRCTLLPELNDLDEAEDLIQKEM